MSLKRDYLKIYLGPAGIPSVSKKLSTLEGIRTVKSLGLNAMEIEFVYGVRMSLEQAKEIGRAAKNLGILLSVHAPYYINLCSKEKIKIEESKKRILDSLERANLLGAWIVVFHPGYYGNLTKGKAYEIIKKECLELSEKITENKWKVKLGLETTGKISQFGTLEEIIKISREVENCVPVIDWAHIFARNFGRINYKEIFEKISILNLSHLHTHFSGIEYGLKGEKNHIVMNSNKPSFEELAKEILNQKINITIISESPIIEQDSLKMKEIFENLGYKFS